MEHGARGARGTRSTLLAEHTERGARGARSTEHAERGARGTRHGMLAERAGGEQWSEKWSDEWAGDRGLRGRFSGRIGRLESLPRYAPILILEQAITGTAPGSACGKAGKFRRKLVKIGETEAHSFFENWQVSTKICES